MPKRNDIQSILIIGAGPIVIGQACEFDYSGTQACKALREEGYRIILVNSNPATIMTDPDLADATYIEPITPEIVEQIIAKERPDALLPTMGGQTALNCALALEERGVLSKYNVEMIGAKADVIDKAEDREKFRAAMDKIGLENPRAAIASSPPIRNEAGAIVGYDRGAGFATAMRHLEEIGLPAIIRPAFTLGGTGGGVAYNREEYETIVRSGIEASPTGQVLIDESLLGWKEYEMEVVRDKADNCIIICSIENIDPMGVHTGDSITVAPALTLTDKEYQIMRNASLAVLREIGVETGGSNVQFAVNPENGRLVVIEMNPRVSRSSALASKATGFPIAKVAAKLAVGYTLDELDNDITGGATPASFEPTIDYVVTKIPRFAFEKFKGAEPNLTTAMKSVGEVMAIGRTFAESLQKALRGLETGLSGLDPIEIHGVGQGDDANAVRKALGTPTPDRLLNVAQAMRLGISEKDIHSICKIDPWFLEQIKAIVDTEKLIEERGLPAHAEGLRKLKAMGFSDHRLATLTGKSDKDVRALRHRLDVRPVYKRIDTCAAEFASPTAYMYSTYEAPFAGATACEAEPSERQKVVILGGGPNRIGQGIEFDYCCCHAAFALKDAGYEAIMVNCNPETVSTDYDTSDRLYFEPLTSEDTLEILKLEQSKGTLKGVIVQFGGQTPLKLARDLMDAGIPILGTSPDMIDLAEDRDRFQKLLHDLDLQQPDNGIARSIEEAEKIVAEIGYPVVIRPSYVLGGRGMEIIRDDEQFQHYIHEAVVVSGEAPVLIDSYLSNAIEVDVDALCDGKDVFMCGLMEHIEEAGIHSGDSACSLPAYNIGQDLIRRIEDQTRKLALALNVGGLMNVQFAVKDDEIYVLEVNPRASRTVPFVAKTIGEPIAKIAARVMAGETLESFSLKPKHLHHMTVKEAVFPFARFPGVDTILGPEMRSTGEVMGIDRDFAIAFAKAQIASGHTLPTGGTAFFSVKDADKARIIQAAKRLHRAGFKIIATSGTQRYLEQQGITCSKINKVLEGRPHIVDAIKNGEVQLVFNTTEGAEAIADSRSLRRSTLVNKVPYYTTVAGSVAAAKGIEAYLAGNLEVRPLQSYFE
ncbi:carbamoyl-phosphate synthase large subunit [Pseudovibrio exalbescens]|uniref:carbamoyl-phosphate synthase large subunit n=1 Tax=Pseudovibrio exalbescens TaxID=197461 RepID=UPI002366A1F1|nr:carbamoyl-phosphate synthase large subunit [Pseudovibrio exalbescens]MDD7910248.1 carbamoyl-phosphate synthase large subunit [Pseudovibrio exalbescens]